MLLRDNKVRLINSLFNNIKVILGIILIKLSKINILLIVIIKVIRDKRRIIIKGRKINESIKNETK